MNIEVYEKKSKERAYNEKENKLSPEEEKAIIKGLEQKESVEKETKTARYLCAEYHRKLDATTYFDSKAMKVSKELLPKFKKLNPKLLPESVGKVIKHRTIYLTMMVALGKKPNIAKFMDKFAPSATNLGIFGSNMDDLEDEIFKSSEYKSLNAKTFLYVNKTLLKAQKALQPLLKGNYATVASRFLKAANAKVVDVRVDDAKAARNLEAGIRELRKRFRKWSVFFPNKRPKIKKKQKTA